MKCFVIIHLITQRAANSVSAPSPLPPSQMSEHIMVSKQPGHPDEQRDKRKVGKTDKGNEEKWKHNGEECKESCVRCVFMLSSLMIHSSCFHSTGPPQGITDHQPKHVPLTEAQRHGGRGGIAMDGFERGGPKRHAVYSMCAHCAAFRSCQKWNKHVTNVIPQWDFHDPWMATTGFFCFVFTLLSSIEICMYVMCEVISSAQ